MIPSPKEFVIYAFTQGTIFQFYTGDWLRSYGVGTPNGSLWTISVIVQFYIVIWILRGLLNKKNRKWVIGLYAISVAFSIGASNIEGIIPEILYKFITVSVFPYLHIFLLGALVNLYYEELIPTLKKYIIPLGITYCLARFFALNFVNQTGISLGVNYDIFSAGFLCLFCIAVAYKIGTIRFKHEISYEIYIWHMIFVNVGVELLKSTNRSSLMVLSFCGLSILLTFIASYYSNLLNAKLIGRKKI